MEMCGNNTISAVFVLLSIFIGVTFFILFFIVTTFRD